MEIFYPIKCHWLGPDTNFYSPGSGIFVYLKRTKRKMESKRSWREREETCCQWSIHPKIHKNQKQILPPLQISTNLNPKIQTQTEPIEPQTHPKQPILPYPKSKTPNQFKKSTNRTSIIIYSTNITGPKKIIFIYRIDQETTKNQFLNWVHI